MYKQQQNLLYIACTKRKNIPIPLLQLHLKVMHNFLKFHYGPQWSLHVLGNTNIRSNTKDSSISKSDLYTCLSQLPFLCGQLPTRSCEALCSSEQVQVNDDLRSRLVDNLTKLCDTAFIYQPPIQQQQQQQQQHHHHLHHHHHRNSFFSSNSMKQPNLLQDSNTIITTTWSNCFLFTREKLVAQCHNTEDKTELQDEFIYFLKLLVAHYLQEKQEARKYYIYKQKRLIVY